jgi:adenine-specific DNA-methyltransferase
MSTSDKNRNRLINLLKELFQLDQPELDFGLYKIMHAKSVQITKFLESDLLKEIEQAFGQVDVHRAAEAKANYEEAIEQAKKFGAPHPEETEGVKEAKSAYEKAKDSGNAESEIYDHLYRFFERYYDSGDFMSRRYYARESDSRAAPYSVPYDGREVYLHWANKDQYYIKSSESLSNYSFELNAAIRQQAQKTKGAGLEAFATLDDEPPLKVHFRIIDAGEGEHGNIKAASDQKRFFLIHEDVPIVMDNGELVIQFHYRVDAEKTGQDSKWQEKRLEQAELAILNALEEDASASGFLQGLSRLAPTDSKAKRTLLGKYLYQYAARNTMDYFIHKNLGGFMRRELDFYIKNEIMRLDDIENADAPKVEQYLAQIRVLRRIAQQLIAFLAQLEDFQLKLWLKKKFVTETHYCITLDRVPEKFYAEIAVNDKQLDEWEKLFAISEINDSAANQKCTSEFLKNNPFLLLDTALFSDDFKQQLLAELPDLDAQCDGVLIHSENFQALGLMQQKYREQVKSIYIDPPYNTGEDGFTYKDAYQHSSWLTMMLDRLTASYTTLNQEGVLLCSIDDYELNRMHLLMRQVFSDDAWAATFIRKRRSSSAMSQNLISQDHEYITCYTKKDFLIAKGIPKEYGAYKNPDNDPRGDWTFGDLTVGMDSSMRPNQFYELISPFTDKAYPANPNRVWAYIPESMEQKIQEGRVAFPDDPKLLALGINITAPMFKRFKADLKSDVNPVSTLIDIGKGKKNDAGIVHLFAGLNTEATKELQNTFGNNQFSYAKPISLVSILVDQFCPNKTDCVLDYFAGSGTTAHAVINLNREDASAGSAQTGKRKYILVEQNNYFDTVLKPRIQKVVYSKDWKNGKPVSREGISHCFKTLRLESYEDTLNNLVLKADSSRDTALANNADLQRDYLLNYFLDVETQASQSLLNIADFRDPTAYQMNIKKPGSEEQTLQAIDLIETFNWLIGLWVQNMAAPHSFSAEFEREHDVDLPKDQNTRLLCKRLKADNNGDYWFRLIEGYTLKVPGDESSKVATLIVWRKQTDDAEKDNAVLQKFLLEKLQISPREHTYGVIYINGSHTQPNPVVEGEQTKVRLIEEAFHDAMWSGEAV